MAEKEELAELLQKISAVHNADELPLTLGSVKQNYTLMERLGLTQPQEKAAHFINDDITNYFTKNPAAYRILSGLESEDKTPVGVVAQRAPLDITSVFYPIGLGVQIIEVAYDLFKYVGSEEHAKETQAYIWALEKEAKDAIKKRHQEEEPTGIIKYIDPRTGKMRIIEQWRDPKNIPDCCLGGMAGGGGEYFTSPEEEKRDEQIDLSKVDPYFAVIKQNYEAFALEVLKNTHNAIDKTYEKHFKPKKEGVNT